MTKQAFAKYMGKLLAFLLALCVPFALLIGFIGFVPETSQQSLLYTFTADIPGDGRVLALAGDLVDLINIDDASLGFENIVIRRLDEPEKDVLHVLAHIARFR